MNEFNLAIDKSDWIEVKLGDISKEISERVDNPAASKYENFVGLEHFVSGELKIKRFSGTKNLVSATKAFRSGDILFARRNVYLKRASLVEFEGVCSGDAFVLRENSELIIPGFLSFVLNSSRLWDFAISNAAGTMSKRVKWRDLAEFKLNLPPIKVQKEIAELIWSINSCVEANTVVLKNAKSFQTNYFENLLAKNRRERAKLKDVLMDIFAGKSPKGFSRKAEDDEFAVLKVSAVGNCEYVETENKALIEQSEFNSKYEVKEGFVLVTRANANLSGIGRPCLVEHTRPGLMLSDKTLRLIPNLEVVNTRFLYQLVQTNMYRQYVESVAGGTEAKNISQKLLGNAPIWLPNELTQSKVENKLLLQDVAIANANKQLSNSKELQNSIINQVF